MVKKILHYVAVPAMFLIGAVITYLTISKQWNFELAGLGIFILTSLLILILELLIPLKVEWRIKKGDMSTDMLHLITVAVFDALGKAMALSVVLYLHQWLVSETAFWDKVSFPLAYLTANVLGELLPYVYHRISHTGKESSFTSLFLWKVHSIHHLPKAMNLLKSNWMHPLNMFLNTFLKYGPLFLMGFAEEVIFAVGVTHVVVAIVSHANIISKTGFLDYLIVTPQVHHFHHSTKLDEAKNYGNILPVWDLIFGTYFNRKGTVGKIGVVEARYDYPKPHAFLAQIMFPMNAYKNCCAHKKYRQKRMHNGLDCGNK